MSARNTHPAWCTRDGCESRGWHISRRLTVDRPNEADTVANLRLVQLMAADTEPHITLTGTDDEAPVLLLTVAQARMLRRFLGRLADLAA